MKVKGLLDDQCLVPEDSVLPGEVVAGLVAEGGAVLVGQLHVGGDVLQGRGGVARLGIESTICFLVLTEHALPEQAPI